MVHGRQDSHSKARRILGMPPALPGPAISASKTKELMMNDSARGRELKETGRKQDAHLSSSEPMCHDL